MVPNYSTVIDSDSRDVKESKKLSIGSTIETSSNQLNKYNYTKQKRILKKPIITEIKYSY